MDIDIEEVKKLNNEIDETIIKDLRWKEAFPQIIASIIAVSTWFLIGHVGVFSAILLPQLMTEGSEIIIDDNQKSWIGSIMALSVIPGSIINAYIVDIAGRKLTTMIQTIPFAASWICIIFSKDVTLIYLSRILAGLACGMSSASAVYVTEISHPKLRGSLCNIGISWASIGTVMMYILGAFLHWRTISYISVIFPLISFILLFFIPESPRWLNSVGKEKKAEKALKWIYRETDRFEIEWKTLKNETSLKNKATNENLLKRLQRLMEIGVLKPMGVLLGLYITQQFSGIYYLLSYTVEVFQKTAIDMDPFLAAILVGVFRMIGSFFNILLSHRIGRRTLCIISGLGMTVTLIIAGVDQYFSIQNQNTSSSIWISLLSILAYIFFSTLGFLSLPWSMAAELLPLHSRGIGSGFGNAINHIIMFATLKLFPFMADVLLTYGMSWFFATFSLAGTIFVYFLLPETLGKSLIEIEQYFMSKKCEK